MSSPRPPPSWPGDASKHTTLVDALVELPMEKLFLLMQGGFNDFRKKLESLNGHSDYASTGWVAPPLPPDGPLPSSRPVMGNLSALKADMLRKTTFRSGKYATSEYSKLLEVDSKHAVVESYVETKAPYGDRFQVIIRTWFEADMQDKKATRLTVKCAMVYTGSINGMIRGMIEKGTREGMEKGNRNAIELLKEQVKVTPVGSTPAGPASKAKVLRPSISREHLETLFGKRLVAVLEPYAVLTYEVLQQMHPSMAVLTPTRIGIVCLTLAAFQVVHLLLDVLIMLKSGSDRHSGGFMGYGLQLFFRVFHVPTGMHEVLCNFALLAFVRGMLGVISLALPDPRTKEGHDGTTYNGYKAAIANAEPQYVGIDAKSEFALEQIGKGLDYFASKFKPSGDSSEPRQHRRDRIKEKFRSYRNQKSKHRDHDRSEGGRGGETGHHHHRHGHGHHHQADGEDAMDASAASPTARNGNSLPLNDSVEYCAPSLPPERTVVEEIFECQRHQPFRGWGSKWPGHFLPTDQMNRWNVRTAKSNGIYTSQNMDDVAPDLPEGWEWVEEEWTLDLSGTASGSTDASGWSYGLDFARDIVFPFPPGSGRSKITDFVRTRRWLRTRVLPRHGEGEAGVEATERQADSSQTAGTSSKSNTSNKSDGGKEQKGKEGAKHGSNDVELEVTSRRLATETAEDPLPTLEQHDSLFFDQK